ncbi:lytic murein transglycosylase [Methyloligella sp. 2.7D]|uniref:lytic murein transglycosylase n=1 Tax=unclassified Methyloligella TaxID=2625955 RepID=UPI00157C060D|nr:lytic murein transglycosylase [Methyloligella sp. GL2]QKP76759.1 lytic murein transglycosylase [Methyloligella sp. GL2]
MRITRLAAGLALSLAVLLLCLTPARADSVSAYRAAVDKEFAAWIAARWPEAEAAGVSRQTFETQTRGLKFDWDLPHLSLPDPAYAGGPALPQSMKPKAPRHQPEFDSPGRYFSANNLNALASQGRAKYAQYKDVLAAVQQRFGVPASIIVAIWGRETGYGGVRLPYDALSAIATQGFAGMRKDVFTKEFVLALKVLQYGHVSRAEMRSSWAGAMGHTQFLPSDFLRYSIDFDGDGAADIWNSTADALASTGNSLRDHGWIASQAWGYEVSLPKGFDCTLQGPDKARPFSDWIKLGIVRVKGRQFKPETLDDSGFLVLPAGMKGPAFLVTENFSVLKKYNNSDVYALFVGHLADMIAYNSPANFVGAWLPVERFTRPRILDFQKVLVSRYGYDVGKVDGLVGFKTRQAIGLYEKRIGAPLTCYPSEKIVASVLAQR